jgi:hypothetical protein
LNQGKEEVEKPFLINNNKAEFAVLKPLVIDKMRLPCSATRTFLIAETIDFMALISISVVSK